MTCNALLVAQNILVDKNANRVSIINLIEEITISQLPMLLPISILVTFRKEITEIIATPSITLKISMEDSILLNNPLAVNFIEGSLNTKTAITIDGLMISSAGEMLFEILYDGTVLKSETIRVKEIAQKQS